MNPVRGKRSRWGAKRARTTDSGSAFTTEGLPRHHRFSYEVPNNEDELLQPLAPRTSRFSFRPDSKIVDAANTLAENPFNFGTAFEFAPSTIEDPDKMMEREKKGRKKGFQEEDVVPKAYTSIFTYESSFANDSMHNNDYADEYGVSKANGVPNVLLIFLSILLLLLFFPIMIFFCVKHTSPNERIIVFRLKKRLKTKGPGFCFVLPCIDNFHIIDLEDQNIKIKPVSGSTSDESQVEMSFDVHFHITDPEIAVRVESDSPEASIVKIAASSFASAVARLEWDDLKTGHALPDLASEIRAILNSNCGAWGIQINQITLGELKTIKEPLEITETVKRLDLTQIGKQIANLSPLFMGSGTGLIETGTQAASTAESSGVPPGLAQFNDMIARIASMKKTPKTDNGMKESAPIEVKKSPISEPIATPARDLERLNQIVGAALNRAQVFLDNAQARRALGDTSMQVFVYRGDVSASGEHVAAFYVDSATSECGYGLMPESDKATVKVHITTGDFAETILGRLDMIEMVNRSRIRISGDIMALAKLRFLLQFK